MNVIAWLSRQCTVCWVVVIAVVVGEVEPAEYKKGLSMKGTVRKWEVWCALVELLEGVSTGCTIYAIYVMGTETHSEALRGIVRNT